MIQPRNPRATAKLHLLTRAWKPYTGKPFFDGEVNPKANSDQLAKLGLMGETQFKTAAKDGGQSYWEWWTEAELQENHVASSAEKKQISDLQGFTPLVVDEWTEQAMSLQLITHGVAIGKLGQGQARSIQEFVQEANLGETRLYSNGKDLMRRLEILIVKIKNSSGCYLIETGHIFGNGRTQLRDVFPATKLRPLRQGVGCTSFIEGGGHPLCVLEDHIWAEACGETRKPIISRGRHSLHKTGSRSGTFRNRCGEADWY